MAAGMKKLCEVIDGVTMPVPAHKHNSVFLVEGLKESIYDSCSFNGVELMFNRSRRWETVFQFVQGHIIDAVSLCSRIGAIPLSGNIADNSADIAQ